MENLFLGISTIAVAATGYFFAFRLSRKDKTGAAILLLMLAGLLLRVYTASDPHLHEWDERYHALVAKNMMDHPLKPMLYENPVLPYDYRNWWGNHIWMHKQPVPLWAMAGSMSLFGVNEMALRLPSILLSTLGIWLTFAIGKNLFSKRVGFIAAFLFSIHGLIIELTAGRVATDHTDLFFLCFIELAVLLAIKFVQTKKPVFNVLCGISIGLAILSKWLPALIVLPLWLLLIMDSRNFSIKETILHFSTLCLVLVAVALPWQIYTHLQFPLETRWEHEFNRLHLTETLDERGGPFYYHFDKMRMIFGELIYLPVIWFLYKSFKRPKNYRRLLITTWFLIPFLFFSFAATKMQGYTIFTAPALFIITALFWDYLKRYRERFRFRWAVNLILILLLALPVRYSLERIKPFEKREREPQWAKELKELNVENPKVVLFNVENAIEAMFYNNCTAYGHIPDTATLKRLEEMGYEVRVLGER